MNNPSGGGRGPRESPKGDALDLDGLDPAAQAKGAPLQAVHGISPSMDPEQERAAQQVSVPKAPLVPHDIERMPNRDLPRWSARPGFTDDEDEPEDGARARRHTDADLPPPIRFEAEDAPPSGRNAASAPAASATPVVSFPSQPQGVAMSGRTVMLVTAALIVLAALFAWLR